MLEMTGTSKSKVVVQKRRHKREKCHCTGTIYDRANKTKGICATFDISLGGTRIVTDSQLAKKDYEITIGKQKFIGKVVHLEERHSSMMDKKSYYYGIQFKKMLSESDFQKFIKSCKSTF